MKHCAQRPNPVSRYFPGVLLLLFLSVSAGPALAQGGAALRGLPEEQVDKAIGLQVNSVARELGLGEAEAGKLRSSYKQSRENLMEEIRRLLGQGVEDNAKLMNDVYAIQKEASKQLVAATSGYLNKEQQDRIGKTLGAFNLQWDGFVLNLNELGLSPEVQAKAEAELIEFVTSYSPVRDEGYMNGDLSFVVRGMVQSKQELDRNLKEILPPAAFTTWTKKTELRFQNPDR